MKFPRCIISISILAFVLTACNVQQNYAVQYTFTNEVTTETKVEQTSDGIEVTIAFADISCDFQNLGAVLERQSSDFFLRISGAETSERCSSKFSASISGIQSGSYTLHVVYDKNGEMQQVLTRDFTVQ